MPLHDKNGESVIISSGLVTSPLAIIVGDGGAHEMSQCLSELRKRVHLLSRWIPPSEPCELDPVILLKIV